MVPHKNNIKCERPKDFSNTILIYTNTAMIVKYRFKTLPIDSDKNASSSKQEIDKINNIDSGADQNSTGLVSMI